MPGPPRREGTDFWVILACELLTHLGCWVLSPPDLEAAGRTELPALSDKDRIWICEETRRIFSQESGWGGWGLKVEVDKTLLSGRQVNVGWAVGGGGGVKPLQT